MRPYLLPKPDWTLLCKVWSSLVRSSTRCIVILLFLSLFVNVGLHPLCIYNVASRESNFIWLSARIVTRKVLKTVEPAICWCRFCHFFLSFLIVCFFFHIHHAGKIHGVNTACPLSSASSLYYTCGPPFLFLLWGFQKFLRRLLFAAFHVLSFFLWIWSSLFLKLSRNKILIQVITLRGVICLIASKRWAFFQLGKGGEGGGEGELSLRHIEYPHWVTKVSDRICRVYC